MSRKFAGIIDSTLREGEQTPGIRFTDSDRRSIIINLHRVGIEEIELGTASPTHNHLRQLVYDARKITGNNCRFALWSRCRDEDIIFAASCRPDVLSMSIPVSDLHIEQRLQKDRTWIKHTLAQSIKMAFSLGIPYISVGMEDSSRADPVFLKQVVQVVEKNGAQRVRLADTVGTCSPGRMQRLVELVKNAVDIEIGVHCHNDFGMATANSIAAVESGAEWLDATVIGLGERAGNCRLEEVVGFMALIGKNRQYQPQHLSGLCRSVAEMTNNPILGNHPIVGDDIFTCETGLHQHGLSIDPMTYEPYAPHRIGTVRKLRFGSKTGQRAVKLQMSRCGLNLDTRQIRSLTDRIRSSGRSFTGEQLFQFALQHMEESGQDQHAVC